MKHIKKYNEEIEEKKTLKEKIEAVISDQYNVHSETNNEEINQVLKDILNDLKDILNDRERISKSASSIKNKHNQEQKNILNDRERISKSASSIKNKHNQEQKNQGFRYNMFGAT